MEIEAGWPACSGRAGQRQVRRPHGAVTAPLPTQTQRPRRPNLGPQPWRQRQARRPGRRPRDRRGSGGRRPQPPPGGGRRARPRRPRTATRRPPLLATSRLRCRPSRGQVLAHVWRDVMCRTARLGTPFGGLSACVFWCLVEDYPSLRPLSGFARGYGSPVCLPDVVAAGRAAHWRSGMWKCTTLSTLGALRWSRSRPPPGHTFGLRPHALRIAAAVAQELPPWGCPPHAFSRALGESHARHIAQFPLPNPAPSRRTVALRRDVFLLFCSGAGSSRQNILEH